MGDRLTTRAEADDMSRAIRACVDKLERRGYTRGQIGAAMAGISLGIVTAHNGPQEASRIISSVQDAIGSAGARQ